VSLRLRWTARSEIGLVREGNEDSGYAGDQLLMIADGMGGMVAGDLASELTVQALRHLDHDPPGDVVRSLRRAVLAANDRLRVAVEADPALEGMGTTVTALLWDGEILGLAHIGDSRGYLLRDGRLERITHDHTFVQSLVDEGRLTEGEARVHPHRSLLLRALDGRTEVEPDTTRIEVAEGDRFLLCSDGLCGYVDDAAIGSTLATADRDAAVDGLVDLALAAGGLDNVTCLVADVVAIGSAADRAGSSALAGTVLAGTVPAGEAPDGTAPAGGSTGGSAAAGGSTGGSAAAGGSAAGVAAVAAGDPAPGTAAVAGRAAVLGTTAVAAGSTAAAGADPRRGTAVLIGAAAHGVALAPHLVDALAALETPQSVDRRPRGRAESRAGGAGGVRTAGTGRVAGALPAGTPGESGGPGVPGVPGGLSVDADPEELRYAPLHPGRFRWVTRVLVLLLVVAVVGGGGWWSWGWTQRQYYIGAHGSDVAIYRGLPDSVLGVSVSSVYSQDPALPLASLPLYYRQRVQASVSAGNLVAARDVMAMLRRIADHCRAVVGDPSCSGDGPLTATPTATPAVGVSPGVGATPSVGATPAGGVSPGATATPGVGATPGPTASARGTTPGRGSPPATRVTPRPGTGPATRPTTGAPKLASARPTTTKAASR